MTPLVERFLADFHDRAPGGSSRAFGGLPVHDTQGRRFDDSYQALVATLVAAALPPGPVLDLACGDGLLLQRLGAATTRALLGVDLSVGELAVARSRLGPAVPLHRARAQALPLASGTLAAVTCHMALMLMAEPETVVAELARVLQPGGRLLALVPAAPAPDAPLAPLTAAYVDALAGHGRRPEWQALRFEGRRWCAPAALSPLLGQAFEPPRITPLCARQRFSPDQAWAWFTDLYDLHLLPPAAWPAVQAGFHARLAPLRDAAGQVSLPHAYLLIDATRAS